MGWIFLFLHSAYFRINALLIPMLILAVKNIVIESLQLAGNSKRYIKNIWNWFDILRILFTFAYFVISYIDSISDDDKSTILTMLNLVYSFKLFSLFSLHKKTRVLLRIVIEILIDMIPFLLFCIVATILLALMFTSSIS